MLTIKVLGPGCANCKRLEMVVQKATAHLNGSVSILKLTDWEDIMQYPILATPGLVIDEKVVSSGRVPSLSEVGAWVNNALA